MNLLNLLGKVRKVLTKITDFLIAGRQRGLWEEGQGSTRPKSYANPAYAPPPPPPLVKLTDKDGPR